jgi:acyltransferase
LKKNILLILHRILLYSGVAYIGLALLLFFIFGRIETYILGLKFSFTSLVNPIRISFGLLFLSFLTRVLGANKIRLALVQAFKEGWLLLRSGGLPSANRLYWIDNLKAVAIFLMVLGHTNNSVAFIPRLITYIYSFHMPLFFFISGMTFRPEKYQSLKEIISKKSATLLLPYFFFSFIGYGLYLINDYEHFSVYSFGEILFRIIYADTDLLAFTFDGPLWFLPCLFLVEIEAFAVSFLGKRIQATIVGFLTILGFIWGPRFKYIPWSAAVSLVGLCFFWSGYRLKVKLYALKKPFKIWIIAVGLVLNLVFCQLNSDVSMATDCYGNPIFFLLAALGGILYTVILLTYSSPRRLLTVIGMNTIIILGLHGDLLFFLLPKTEPLIHLSAFYPLLPLTKTLWINSIIEPLNKFMFSMILTGIQLGFVYFLIPLFNRKMYFLLGRKKPPPINAQTNTPSQELPPRQPHFA